MHRNPFYYYYTIDYIILLLTYASVLIQFPTQTNSFLKNTALEIGFFPAENLFKTICKILLI